MKETGQHMRNSMKRVKQHKEEERESVDLIGQNIETIADLYAHAQRGLSPHQKIIERVTAFLGRPLFLYVILLFVALWIGINLAQADAGLYSFDPPPFYWLQGIIALSALLMTNVVLITQNRQKKLTEQRRHLDLQINLLAEQKITKLIAMVEELRRDLPATRNARDPEIEAMMESVNPHEVLATLDQALEEALAEEGQ
jgi:uncharacterized membrane protein